MKKVLVTGAAGFIGFHFANRLLEEGGALVLGIDNINDYYDQSLKHDRLAILKRSRDFLFVELDICDLKFTEIVADFQPDLIVHFAAQAGVRYSLSNPDDYIKTNLIGFYNVVKSCLERSQIPLMYASSSSVYGNNSLVPFDADEACDKPVSLYAATKRANELIAHSFHATNKLSSVGFRFFTVYGPYGRPDMAYFSFTRKILNGEKIDVYNNGDLRRDFTYVDDIVETLIRSKNHLLNELKEPICKIYNIGNNQPVELKVFIQTLENLLGVEAIKDFKPMQLGDVYETYANVSPIMEDYGFKPQTPLTAGLKSFVDWYKSYYSK